MVVLVLIAVAPGLRGHVTRWLVELAPGVYAGTLSARVRDRLWDTLEERVGDGQAVLVFRARNEQGWSVRTAGRDRWSPVDLDGLMLMQRPPVLP
jgi:CRISPR-associated protein Cas2